MTPKNIRLLFEIRDLEHQQIAEDIGCTKSELSQIINGHRVNVPLRKKLAKRLGMSVDELFGADHDAATKDKRQEVSAA